MTTVWTNTSAQSNTTQALHRTVLRKSGGTGRGEMRAGVGREGFAREGRVHDSLHRLGLPELAPAGKSGQRGQANYAGMWQHSSCPQCRLAVPSCQLHSRPLMPCHVGGQACRQHGERAGRFGSMQQPSTQATWQPSQQAVCAVGRVASRLYLCAHSHEKGCCHSHDLHLRETLPQRVGSSGEDAQREDKALRHGPQRGRRGRRGGRAGRQGG